MRLVQTHIRPVLNRSATAKKTKIGTSQRVLILLAKTTYRAKSFMEAGRKLGLEISVGSNHQQSLSEVVPGSSLLLDPDDIITSAKRIVEFHSRYELSGVVAAEDDFAILAATAAESIGLVQHSLKGVSVVRNKGLMREKLAGKEGYTIWFQSCDLSEDINSILEKIRFPCVVKPTSLSGSRGVTRCNNSEEFMIAWTRLNKILESGGFGKGSDESLGEVVIEEYLEGREVAVEGIMDEGRLMLIGILDKPDPMEGPFFEETILITPSRLSALLQKTLTERTEQIAINLGLENGPIHAEFRVKAEEINLLEIAPRSIGGYCSRIFRFQPESTLEELILRHSLGRQVDHYRSQGESEGVFMLPVPKEGKLHNVFGIEEARSVKGIKDVEITLPTGAQVLPLPDGNQYLGFLFAKGKNPEFVESALREAFSILSVEIQ